MPPKKPAPDGTLEKTPSKHPRTDNGPEEFSNAVKKRLLASTRTGQACDRCKVRKIRCDGLPGGCSPCIQNNVECRTTDRITGRATSRGYVEGLEAQNREMISRIRELEARLMHSGVEVKPANTYHELVYDVPPSNGTWDSLPATTPVYVSAEPNAFRTLPAFRAHSVGDNYLGVATNSSHLSPIKGTALSILGMEIDIADFPSADMDEPDPSVFHPSLYNKSYQSLLQSIFNINPKHEKPELPPREEGLTHAQWYFRAINPYNPMLHKRSFINLLTRMYDEPEYHNSPAENAMVHTVFAIMFFQYSCRNVEDAANQSQLNAKSNMHYHYALGLVDQLFSSHTVEDVQALALLCAHLRNFPKPGASWMLSMMTMTRAIEIGLHRSSRRWPSNKPANSLETEIRKRTFWGLLAIHSTICSKLGRPMSLRLNDIDVELPEPVNDEVLLPNDCVDICEESRCIHALGLYAWKILPLFMELHATIYAVRREAGTYVDTVNRLEAKWKAWKDCLPPALSLHGPAADSMDAGTRVFALWAEHIALEFKLLLRHPSVSLTTDVAFNAESMRMCVEASRQLLAIVREMQKFKSLDTTWYNSSLYVMAITTTLFAQWERRSEATATDLAALRLEMDDWLDVMGEIGALLGSGTRLREAIRVVVDGTIVLLSRTVHPTQVYPPGNAQDLSVKADTPQPSEKPLSQGENGNSEYPVQTYPGQYPGDNSAPTQATSQSPYVHNESQLPHQQTPYPAATQYSSYPEPTTSSSSGISYAPQEGTTFQNYSGPPDSVEAPLLAAFAAQASQAQQGNWQRPPSNAGSSASQVWHQWTSTMAGNLEPQDCYSANALMSLGGRDPTGDNTPTNQPASDLAPAQNNGLPVSSGEGGITTNVNNNVGATWPLNIFDINQTATAPQGA